MTAPPRPDPTSRTTYLDPTAVSDRTAVIDRTPVEPNEAGPVAAEQRFTLSATQVLASMAAAVTAALVGSRLGVAGTVIGAGLASVISVVGGAVIGHSILLTRTQVKRAVLQVRGGSEPDSSVVTTVLPAHPSDDYTVVIPAVTRFDLEQSSRDARTGPGHAEPGRPHPTRRKVRTGVLWGVAAALAIFVSSLGAVTLLETIKGSPVSGGESGGLSVLGGGGGGADSGDVVAPEATTTAVRTESATVTQTVTSEVSAPATTTAANRPTTAAAQPTAAGQTAASSQAQTSGSASTSAGGAASAAPGTAAAPTVSPTPGATADLGK